MYNHNKDNIFIRYKKDRVMNYGNEQDNTVMTEETLALLRENLKLECSFVPVINFALQQNRIPFLQSLSLENGSTEPASGLDIVIKADPEIFAPFTRHIDYVAPGEILRIKDAAILLSAGYLSSLSEKITGTVTVSLLSGGALISSETREITALAFDQWQGESYYPEMLASYVTPNDPAAAGIKADASALLQKWTGDPSFDAYLSRSEERVLMQAAAIYGALQQRNITYSVSPASFEQVGQRIRLPGTLLGQRTGNCLDLTLLYASCLEAAGLSPIIILTPGHAFAGVWLNDLSFSEPVQDDASLITKRLPSGAGEIAVVETTCVTVGNSVDFDGAMAAAEQKLLGQSPVDCIIDVKRSRLSGVTPLPLIINGAPSVTPEQTYAAGNTVTSAPKTQYNAYSKDVSAEPEKYTRKVRWERKLLDLGLRNALINMRPSKLSVPLFSASLAEFENALNDGGEYKIYPKPSDWHIPASDLGFETMHSLGPNEELIRSEFKNGRLRSSLTEAELEKTVKELYRASKSSLEENGANTLYLALGLLRWYENEKSVKPRYAPIILLPIEMIRKSAAQGYVIRLRDFEPQMNVTMLEMLKQEFSISIGGLDPLPTDDHGVDVAKVFSIIRNAVMSEKRWDILSSAYLGIFSFSQFVMWNDIRNRSDDLARNKIVKSLMDGKLAWDAESMTMEGKVPEDGVFLPMSADASQLFAIREACKGSSFVLHGPPGTGKSQTITSLIANALAGGKTVLFVAEKMAALEVVEKRLNKIGIGSFCLELHSNKAKKRSVLDQLREATEVTKKTSPNAYAQKANQLSALRAELDSYAFALHKKAPCGLSLFEIIGNYEKYKGAADIGVFGASAVASLTPDALADMTSVVERLAAAGKEAGHPADHPLKEVSLTSYSQKIRDEMPEALSKYKSALLDLVSLQNSLSSLLGMDAPSYYKDTENLVFVSGELNLWLGAPREWASAADKETLLYEIGNMSAHYLKAGEIYSYLSPRWEDGFFSLDGASMLKEYNEATEKWFIGKMVAMSSVVKKVSAYSKGSVNKETVNKDFAALVEYQKEYGSAEALFKVYGKGISAMFGGERINWGYVSGLVASLLQSLQRADRVQGVRDIITRHGGERAAGDRIQEFLTGFEAMTKAKNALYTLLEIREYAGENWADDQLGMCERIKCHSDMLKGRIMYNGIAKTAEENGLSIVVNAYSNGLEHSGVVDAFKKAIYKSLAIQIIDSDEALYNFSGALFEEKVEQLKRLDAEVMKLSQQEIFCILASRVPDFTKEAAQSSELGILQRAIRSGGRGVSLRKIFEQIPNLLPRLCPCMLMSPISAAQYLDPNREPFDIVVFDEASQLTTAKAVGALARGKDAVIVGDPKQMPPTSFFMTNTVDEENIETEDLESILDDCLALNMPQTHLLWHYRSRHESLIAFSNEMFYENKLFTFPSVNDRKAMVTLVKTGGTFDRGKTRQNKAEAEEVINELRRRCHDPALSKNSVGIITFNIQQQDLIDDLLSEACKSDPELEQWAYGAEEPLFIKNLENVQGDERDVILFSVGYGPDKDGKVFMNFGPLNRDGGWRRLNVAVSRARCEMKVFSSLDADDIDLSRTSAEGVAALKAFLEYADGRRKIGRAQSGSKEELSGIADTVCRLLAEHGYSADRNVGHSEYKIDIGVIDPDNKEEYILGILLDGSTYKNAQTTRDREFSQISVLNGLGWTIYRLWSMDWWDNSRLAFERILSRIEAAKEQKAKKAEAMVKEEPKAEKKEPAAEATSVPERSTIESVHHAAAPARNVSKIIGEYKSTVLPERHLSGDEFAGTVYSLQIKKAVEAVIETEAPISENLLAKRVLRSFGITRATEKINARLEKVYDDLKLRSTIQYGRRFFWKSGQQPAGYYGIRASGSDDSKREVNDVPLIECVNAICLVLSEQISMNKDDLVRETAKKLGYTRIAGAVPSVMEQAIAYTESNGLITQSEKGTFVLTAEGEARSEVLR